MIPKLLLILMTALSLGIAACDRQGPAEKMGEDIDQNMDEFGDDMEEAGDEMEDELDDAT